MDQECEVEGVKYESAPLKEECTCKGCAGDYTWSLCLQLGSCVGENNKRFIWIKKSDEPA